MRYDTNNPEVRLHYSNAVITTTLNALPNQTVEAAIPGGLGRFFEGQAVYHAVQYMLISNQREFQTQWDCRIELPIFATGKFDRDIECVQCGASIVIDPADYDSAAIYHCADCNQDCVEYGCTH
jgi:hypothetical protein